MNCNSIARWYGTLEYLSFGFALLNCRCRQLDTCRDAEKVLMLGEGDGRFLRRFLLVNPTAEVDYVDGSERMMRIARERLSPSQRRRVRFHYADALMFVPNAGYDLIVTHFFLDCLSPEETEKLAKRLACASASNARWIVSEFETPRSGWRRLRARLWISSLYLAFRWLTGLHVSKIPDYRGALTQGSFRLRAENTSSAGLLTSQVWEKTG
jgi:ubiquinone/menaquinone biosynthesis C-methylase UbiE